MLAVLAILHLFVQAFPAVQDQGQRAGILSWSAYCPVTTDPLSKSGVVNTTALGLSSFSRQKVSGQQPIWSAAFDNINQEIVVIFRGSQTAQDWIHNLGIFKDPIFSARTDNPVVHGGFLNYAKRFSKDVDNDLSALIQKYPLADVHFIGHSMGGAIAMILPVLSLADGALLRNQVPSSKVKVTTLGTPAIGNQDWIQLYKSKRFKQTRRIVNALDIVPKTLTPQMGYYHYEDELLCINDDRQPQTIELGNGSCNNRYGVDILLTRDFVFHHLKYFTKLLDINGCPK
jgi:hypothetical protein